MSSRSLRPALYSLGHLLVFGPGVLLVLGRLWRADWLVFGGFFVGLSALRAVIGDVPESTVDLSEGWARALDWLPRLYAVGFMGLSAWMATQLDDATLTGGALAWFCVGCWLVASLATCPAHELGHRKARGDRALGRLLAAVAGYPILGHEHLAHHANPGSTARAEYPRRDQSLYGFIVARKLGYRMWRAAFAWDAGERARRPGLRPDSLGVAIGAFIATWAAFGILGGWRGLVWFGVQAAGLHLTLHIITYLQHWGLGDDSLDEAQQIQFAWEETCLSQAWVTMGLSLHQAHHKSPSRPYYRLAPMRTSPRLPASYAIMMLIAFVPPLWRKMMQPALAYWIDNPARPIAPGTAVFCLPKTYQAAQADAVASTI
jgi:alkane 1-monooxygenase